VTSDPPVHDRLQLLLLGGADYRAAAEQLGLPHGLAYLVVTGHAADGSHADNLVSTQDLVNPPAHNPTTNDVVRGWIRQRARSDQQMQSVDRGER
jgi:hypothetical protein